MTYQRLRLGGVTVSGVGTDGVEFRVRPNIDGWWGSPTAQHEVTRRTDDHGSWAGLTTLAPRVLVVAGLLSGPEHTLVVAALERLKSLATRADTTFEVETPSGSKLAMARRDGQVMVTWHSDTAATVSFQFLAADPRLYGALQRTVMKAPSAEGGLEYPLEYDLDYATPLDQQSSASLTNVGNEDAWPVFVAHGPWPGGLQVLAENGQIVRYQQTIYAGQAVVIDSRARTASLGGVDQSQYLTRRGWAPIPAGGSLRVNVMQDGAPDSRGWVDVEWRDTWL